MRWPLKLLKISGHSMEPTLKLGSFVLLWCWSNNYRVGEIVAFSFNDKILVKRIKTKINAAYEVAGDNKQDSLEVGPVESQKIIGRVVLH